MKLITYVFLLSFLSFIYSAQPFLAPAQAVITNIDQMNSSCKNDKAKVSSGPTNYNAEKIAFLKSGPFDPKLDHALYDILPVPISKFSEGIVQLAKPTVRIIPKPIIKGESVDPQIKTTKEEEAEVAESSK